MRVLVDTSVWSLALRKKGPFALLPLERSDFVAAASLHRRCAARGLTT